MTAEELSASVGTELGEADGRVLGVGAEGALAWEARLDGEPGGETVLATLDDAEWGELGERE